MKLIVEIPQEVKEAFDKANKDDINFCYYDYNSLIGKAIKNGLPLDKITSKIDAEIKGGSHCDEYIDGYEDGLKEALKIINKFIGRNTRLLEYAGKYADNDTMMPAT